MTDKKIIKTQQKEVTQLNPFLGITLPSLHWSNRQRSIKIHRAMIVSLVEAALPLCLEKPRWSESSLPKVIEITLLSDRAITKVHGDFLNDPTPTDVITFGHSRTLGEILVGVGTASKNAKKFDHSVDHEIALCVIHGLLHLLDYDDLTVEEYEKMHRRQDEILKAVTTRVARYTFLE